MEFPNHLLWKLIGMGNGGIFKSEKTKEHPTAVLMRKAIAKEIKYTDNLY